MSSPVLKWRNLSLKRRKSTIKVDENDGMFEKECETEEVDDDLPNDFCKPTKVVSHRFTILMKHARMMFCCAIVPLIFRCFIDFGYLHDC